MALSLTRRRLVGGAAAIVGWALAGAVRGPSQCLIGYAHAQDPATIFSVASGVISITRLFAGSGSGDGGLGAMLRADLQYQKAISDQLIAVQKNLQSLSNYMVSLRLSIPDYLETDRIKGYYVDLIATVTQFDETLTAMSHASKREKALYVSDLRRLWGSARSARAKLATSNALFASIAVPVSLALEVASSYAVEQPSLVPVVLQAHMDWCKSICDPSKNGSVANALLTLAENHKLMEKHLLGTGYGKALGTSPGEASLGCVRYVEHEKTEKCTRKSCGIRCDGELAEFCRTIDRPGGKSLDRRLVGKLSETAVPNLALLMTFDQRADAVPPSESNGCSAFEGPFKPDDSTRIQAIESSPQWSQLLADANTADNDVKRMNSYRIEMAAYARALVVVSQCEQQARNRLRALGLEERA